MSFKKIIRAAVFVLIGLAVGGLIGYIVAMHSVSLGGAYLNILLVLAAFYAQLILHEAGHLIAGLLSGYRFVSFRIGTLMLLKSRDKYRLARYKLAGTGGQCLMAPPPLNSNDYPNALYHLGGAAMNLLCALIAAACLALWGFRAWHLGTLAAGLYLALVNGVPLRTRMVDNDGRNALRSRREESVRLGFYRQLQTNAALTDGQRLRDLPADWFLCEAGQEHERGYLRLARLIDEGDYAQARDYAQHLLRCDLPGVHRSLTEIEARCLALLLGEAPSAPDKALKQSMRAMRDHPSVLRAQYVFALLQDHAPDQAQVLRRQFERAARHYPYSGDIQADIEMMRLAQQQFEGSRS